MGAHPEITVFFLFYSMVQQHNFVLCHVSTIRAEAYNLFRSSSNPLLETKRSHNFLLLYFFVNGITIST